jgi:hypothetical protein
MTEIPIEIGATPVGKWVFDDSAGGLHRQQARRTADGFVMPFPSRLHLRWNGDLQPYVSGLRARIRLPDDGTELGVAYDDSLYQAARPNSEPDACLEWRGSFAALDLLEKRRNGRPPRLQLECQGEVCYAKTVGGKGTLAEILRTIPVRFFGVVQVEYPLDAWVDRIRMLGRFANILVEVSVPGQAPAEWTSVLASLEEARLAITRGGESGWRAAIVAIRTALEKWKGIEEPALGPGWNPVSRPDLEEWTKDQRANALRWWLHQFCHLAAHEEARQWARADATLALSIAAALVSARDP